MRFVVLLVSLMSAAMVPLPQAIQEPKQRTVYTVPFDALDTDLVCIDTIETVRTKPCMKVEMLRNFLLDPKL